MMRMRRQITFPCLSLAVAACLIGCAKAPSPAVVPAGEPAAAIAPGDTAATARDMTGADTTLHGLAALEGCRYQAARTLVSRYCADCHTPAGTHRAQAKATRILRVDTYEQWMAASKAIPGRVDLDSLEGKPMPPGKYPNQPTVEERKLLADWVRRGSPNTEDGR